MTILMNPHYFQNNGGSAPEHLRFHCLLASPRHRGWQSVVCWKKQDGQTRRCAGRRGRWTARMSLGGVVLGGAGGGGGGGKGGGEWQMWGGWFRRDIFPAHFVILTSNWGTTYVGVILVQTGLRDQLVIHLWWERTRYGFGQTTGRRESETQ